VVVDHAPGEEVAQSRSGAFHRLTDPRPAIRARGYRGRDLTQSVRAADEIYWESNPFGRDSRAPEQMRDFLELEFVLPEGALSATLALRVRNTSWGAHLQRKLIALLGSARAAFESELDRSPELRAAAHAAMVREGMLLVKTFDGGVWRTVDHVWEVGPAAAREVAVSLALEQASDGVLRIRLESSPGLWRVDRARLDAGPVRTVAGRELRPASVLDTRGREQSDLLVRMDRREVEMPADSVLHAVFSPPPLPHGQARSLFVKASGWYRIHADDAKPGRPELVRRMLAEPGAYGRFALQELAAHVAEAVR
jgi:hypothetical protein